MRGFIARALGQSIFTAADDIESLHGQVKDAVRVHIDAGKAPRMVRLHFVRDDAVAAPRPAGSGG